MNLKDASLITAIKTPFLPNRKIDLQAYDQLLDLQIENGVQGVIVGGTTGEGHLLNWEEHIMLIAHTVNYCQRKIVVIGNTGSNNTHEAVSATMAGFAVGMDAALVINPYYGKTSLEGLGIHFQKVLEIGPSIIYNVPSRTGQDLQPEWIEKIAQHPNCIGIKECAGNERIAYYTSKGISCWSGNDDQCFLARHSSGALGVISVMANIIPAIVRNLMDEEDVSLNTKLTPLIEWLYQEPNPIGINTLLAMVGLIQPVFRLPYYPLSKKEREKAVKILHYLGNSAWLGKAVKILEDDEFMIL